MLIAVNTRFLLKNKLEGIGWYTYETIQRLISRHPEHTFLLIFDRKPDPAFLFGANARILVVGPPARHPFLWYIWFEWSIPRLLKKWKPDTFISTDGFLSLRSKVPTLMVVHDLGFEHYPSHTPALVNRYYRYFTPRYVKKAAGVLTVSRFSKDDIEQRYSLPGTRVLAVHNGAGEAYRPLSEADKVEVRNAFTDGCPYLLYVGSMHPRKNVEVLLQAFDLLLEEFPSNLRLVLAGRKAWHTDSLKQVYQSMKHADRVIFTGHLQQETLTRLVGGAMVFIYPSLFEGFGIPVLEARYCAVPVVCSNRSSLPEVAGPLALMFNPEKPAELKSAIRQMMEERPSAQALLDDAVAAREQFNWERATDGLEQLLHQIDPRFIPAGHNRVI